MTVTMEKAEMTASMTGEVLPAPAERFNYSQVLDDARREIADALDTLKEADRVTIRQVRVIGRKLCEVKNILQHGRFGPWLDEHFRMTDRTAEKYMQAAKLLDKNELGSDLPLTVSALYALASPSMPQAIVDQVQKGEIAPTVKAIGQAKATARGTRPLRFETSHLTRASIADLARLDELGVQRVISEAPAIWRTPEKRQTIAATLRDAAAKMGAIVEALGNESAEVEAEQTT